MRGILIIFWIGWVVVSMIVSCCPSPSTKVEHTLELSGANRHELEKVLKHYSIKEGDSLKLKAAIFLIENMPGHFSYYGEALDNYLDSVHHSSVLRSYPWHLRNMFLIQAYRTPEISQMEGIHKVEDMHLITSDYLIDNIEKAFVAWQKPWAQHFGFDDFCEYLLPYRVDNEPLMYWRDSLTGSFDDLLHSMQNVDELFESPYQACLQLNTQLMELFKSMKSDSVVFNHPLIGKCEVTKFGCPEFVYAVIPVMRSMGIPVSIENIEQWSSRRGKHYWTSLLFTKVMYDKSDAREKYAIITLLRKDGTPYVDGKVEYMVRARESRNRFHRVRTNADGQIRFKVPPQEPGIEPYVYLTLYEKEYRINKRIYIPQNYDYTVGFYPEGGHLIAGANQRVAYKAESSMGAIIHVNGYVINQHKDTLARFTSGHGGVGSFIVEKVPIDTLYAVTSDEFGKEQRYLLPLASRKHISLSVEQNSTHVHYRLLIPQGEQLHEPLGLLVHTRGKIILNQVISPNNFSGSLPISLIPEGITHFAVFNSDTVVVSERLVFIQKKQPVFQVVNSRNPLEPRLPLKVGLRILDEHLQPLQGNFSLSITDDYAVDVDSTDTHIYSYLLLASDLKGLIHAPGYYFAKQDKKRAAQLDELMLTHGWRRFDVSTVFKQTLSVTYPVENSQLVSGYLQTHFDKKVVPNYPLVVTAKDAKFKQIIFTDSLGHFSFTHNFRQRSNELTEFIIQGRGKKKGWRFGIYGTDMDFPTTQSLIWQREEIPIGTQTFIKEVRNGYTLVNGEKVYQLPEVEINALQLPGGWFSYRVVEPERIQQIKGKTALDLLKQAPGVLVMNTIYKGLTRLVALTANRDFNTLDVMPQEKGAISNPFGNSKWSRFWKIVPVLVDGEKLDYLEYLEDIDIKEIRSIDFVREKGMYVGIDDDVDIWDDEITSKQSTMSRSDRLVQPQKIYISTYLHNGFIPASLPDVTHVGYLSYAENAQFYSPKYPTEASRQIVNSDKRTTLHWEPNLRLNERGEAGLSFYTADRPSTYTIVIEGVTTDGKVCRYVKRIK